VKDRRKRCWLVLLVGFLCFCIASTELPELLTLTNNTSNDFTVGATVAKTSVMVAVQLSKVRQQIPQPVLRPPDYVIFDLAEPVTCFSSRDLLVLHSFWRT
jgi:Na+-translocating ferredoxin:NAD+ oxidoreductase RnfE subunit